MASWSFRRIDCQWISASRLQASSLWSDADIFLTRLEERKDSLSFECSFLEQRIDLPVTGKYNATNAMIAAYAEGVSEVAIARAFSELELTRNRTEWKKAAGAVFLSDTMPIQQPCAWFWRLSRPFRPIRWTKISSAGPDMKELEADSKSMHGSMITSLNQKLWRPFPLWTGHEALYDLAEIISGKVHYFIQKWREGSVWTIDQSCQRIWYLPNPSPKVAIPWTWQAGRGTWKMETKETAKTIQRLLSITETGRHLVVMNLIRSIYLLRENIVKEVRRSRI